MKPLLEYFQKLPPKNPQTQHVTSLFRCSCFRIRLQMINTKLWYIVNPQERLILLECRLETWEEKAAENRL